MRDLSGSFQRNMEKESGNPEQANWADLKGKVCVNGEEYWLSGWRRQGEDGHIWYSVALRRCAQQRGRVSVEDGGAPVVAPVEDGLEALPF